MSEEAVKQSNPGERISTVSTGNTATSYIDIERLAEKVYQLMQIDVRLARARGYVLRVRK